MIKRLPIYLVLTSIIVILNYLATKNLFTTVIVGILGIITFLLLIEPMLSKFYLKIFRTKECVWFISNFIITLSINQSIRLTFETLSESFSKSMREQVKLNEHLDVESQISSLKPYFDCDIYNVFLNLLDQYIYNGGDILKISQILLFDVRRIGDEIDNHLALFRRKTLELFSLWLLNFLILIILKVSLNQFYSSIANNMNYIIGIMVFFVVFLINISFFILHGTRLFGDFKAKIKHKKTYKKIIIRRGNVKKFKGRNDKSKQKR